MQKICEKWRAHFPDLAYQLTNHVNELVEEENKEDSAIAQYLVSFVEQGIVISHFDKTSSGILHNSCVDHVIINHSNTKYIELKNGINKDLQNIGKKFYFSFLKSLPILEMAQLKKVYKFIVIYVHETFINEDVDGAVDLSKKKTLINLQTHIKAWKQNKVIIPFQIDTLSPTTDLPIIKIPYQGSPIPLDNY